MLAIAASVILSTRLAASEASIVGTWVDVEGWQAAPTYIQRDHYWSPAIVLHFCTNGQFTMLYCTLYRQSHEYINIGSSDGLQIYRGTWARTTDGAAVTYHLADAELKFTGYDEARKRQIKAVARLDNNTVSMAVISFLPPATEHVIRFQPKTMLPAPLKERFID